MVKYLDLLHFNFQNARYITSSNAVSIHNHAIRQTETISAVEVPRK